MNTATRIADFRLDRVLNGGDAHLATDARGRRVVLKRLPDDCLLGQQLHPGIRLRLSRVRELADLDVATLHGVQSDADERSAWLVWDWIPGQTLEAACRNLPRPQDRRGLFREVVLTVESLHARGIVHGAIHARNVLIDNSNRVRLTHVSPMLYDDPSDDALATTAMLETLAAEAGDAALAEDIRRSASASAPLARLRTLLSGADAPPAANIVDAQRRLRLRALFPALLAALAGLCVVAGVIAWKRHDAGAAQLTPMRAGELSGSPSSPP